MIALLEGLFRRERFASEISAMTRVMIILRTEQTSRHSHHRGQKYLPPFEPMLEEIEQRLLHHVRHFVPFEGRADEDDGPHRWHYVVGRRRLLLLEEGLLLLLRRWCCDV